MIAIAVALCGVAVMTVRPLAGLGFVVLAYFVWREERRLMRRVPVKVALAMLFLMGFMGWAIVLRAQQVMP